MKKTSIILYLIFGLSWSTISQNNKIFNINSFGVQVNRNFIIPHDDTLKPITTNCINHFELSIIQQTNGEKSWHSFLKYPEIGLSIKALDFNNPQILGCAIGALPVINFRLGSFEKLNISIRVGLGLAYISEKYNQFSNPLNVAISSSLNLIGDMNLAIGYSITEKIYINANINALHLSNGSIKKPNYGLNLIGLGIGVNYTINKQNPANSIVTEQKTSKSIYWLSIAGGFKEVGDAGGPIYYPITTQFSYIKPLNKLFQLGASIDLMYDKSTRFHIRKLGKTYTSPKDDFSAGISSRIKVKLHKSCFYGELGAYLYKPNPRFPIIYQRLGFNYQLSRLLYYFMALKTHGNKADHIDIGLAVKL